MTAALPLETWRTLVFLARGFPSWSFGAVVSGIGAPRCTFQSKVTNLLELNIYITSCSRHYQSKRCSQGLEFYGKGLTLVSPRGS